MSGTSPGGRASLRDEPRADKAQLVLHGFAVVLVLAICVHHFRATSAAVCRPHSPPRRASPIKALRPLKPLPPAMGQFSSTRSGPPPEALLHRACRLGASFSNCTAYENEVLAAGASGDLAYTVAFEHTIVSINGATPQPYILRVTTVFRREHGDWKSFTATPTRGLRVRVRAHGTAVTPLMVRRHQARAGQQCRLARGPHTYHPVLRASSGPYRRDCSSTERRLRARLSTWASRSCPPASRGYGQRTSHPPTVYLCIGALGANVRICRVASTDWRPGRVYFLMLLEPLAGTTGLWPLPPGRPVPATVGALSTTVDWFTAHAADRVIPCLTLWDLAIAKLVPSSGYVCPARRSCLFRSPSFRRLRRTR